MGRTAHILAATAEGMGLFDPYTGKPSQFWRFSDEGVCDPSLTLLPLHCLPPAPPSPSPPSHLVAQKISRMHLRPTDAMHPMPCSPALLNQRPQTPRAPNPSNTQPPSAQATLTPGGDAEELIIAVSGGKSSTVRRMMGMGAEAGSKVVLVSMERPRLLTEFLFLRDAALGQLQDPAVFMCAYSASGPPQRKVQILMGQSALRVQTPDGEDVAELGFHLIKRIRRLGDIPGGFAVRF